VEPQERRILFLSSSAHFFTHFYMLLFPALLMPIRRDLGLPLDRVLRVSFAMYLLYGFLATPWGFVADRWGQKTAMSAGQLLAGLGILLGGLLGPSSPALLALAFGLVGVGCAAFHPSGTSLIAQGIRQRGRAMGINGVWGNVGMAAVPFTVGLLNYLIGWRTGLVALGLAGAALGVLGLLTPIHLPRGRDLLQAPAPAQSGLAGLFVSYALTVVLIGLMYNSYTLVLPAFLESRLGNLSEALNARFPALRDNPAFRTLTANLIATLLYVIGIFGQTLGGRAADRYSLTRGYVGFLALALPFAVGLALVRSPLLVLFGGLFVFFSLGTQPIENSLVAWMIPASWRSVGYGLKFTLTFGVGSLAVQLVGWVQRRAGLDAVPLLVVGLLVLAILAGGLLLAVTRGRRIGHPRQAVDGA